MSKLISLVFLMAVVLAGVIMLGHIPPLAIHAATFDAGEVSNTFAVLADVYLPESEWIVECWTAWLGLRT